MRAAILVVFYFRYLPLVLFRFIFFLLGLCLVGGAGTRLSLLEWSELVSI